MVTDARGHEVPADADPWGYREDMGLLSGSINDVRPVADQDAADALVAELVANDIDPTGTTVWLEDIDQVEVYDGTTWHTLPTDESLDGLILTNMSTKPVAADDPSAYPLGWSFMYVTGAESTVGGWPRPGNYWRVLTFKFAEGNAFQYLTRASPNATEVLYRNYTSGAWAPWVGNGPYGQAAGLTDMGSAAGGATISKTVTFPAGLFSQAPIVVVTGNTSYPETRGSASSAASVTATSATLYAYYNGGSGVTAPISLYWTATQMTKAASAALFAARSARAVRVADEPTPDATVTCTTPGCGNADYPIPVISTPVDEDGSPLPAPGGYECGVCGADITSTLQPIGGS